jgi:1-deoxy-D-xylulose-5-phosphate reductoisomerase
MKRLLVLGSTGSIGESTLAVVRAMPDELRVVGLACAHNGARLASQAREFGAEAAAIMEGSAAGGVSFPSLTRLYEGPDAVHALIEETRADIVVNGIGGAAGLVPSFQALQAGADLALANKESLVMAGGLLLAEAATRARRILPVDSEHAALWSLLSHREPREVAALIITASGGAFRDLPESELPRMRAADALRHPTWRMGPKITVDSATLANKGLEVIEAHRLFGIALDAIQVLIHPESQVHAMVRTVDGTLHAELSTPDMRIPIQNALTFPVLKRTQVDWLDLAGKRLGFSAVRQERYPMLGLAYAAARRSPAHPIVYNAANEIAVGLFMNDTIPFTAIAGIVEEALSLEWNASCDSVAEVLAVDAEARRRTRDQKKGCTA